MASALALRQSLGGSREQSAFATQPGTATPEEDYGETAGTLTFDPGVIEQSVSVPIVADAFLAAYPPGSDPRDGARDEAEALKDQLDAYNNLECDDD